MKNIFKTNYRKNPRRLALDLVVLACVILLGVSIYLWWTRIFMDPQRTLNDTLAKNLNTNSITKSVNQSGLTGGINQVAYLSFYAPTVQSQTNTELTQGISSNATTVSTQTIGTSTEDYVRYIDFKAGKNLQGADRLNNLLGQWAKREQNLAQGTQVSFLNESMFGVLPYGNFNDQQRSELLSLISQKNVYKYTAANRMIKDGRPVFVYDMSITPSDLITIIKEYVRLSGAGDAAQLDPEQYRGAADVGFKLTIDILSRQVVEIQYASGRVEKYGGQNLYHPINLPTETIPVEELQKRLQTPSA